VSAADLHRNPKNTLNYSLDSILDALATIIEPDSGKDILRLGLIRELAVTESRISLTVFLKNPGSSFAAEIHTLVENAIRKVAGPSVQLAVEIDNEVIGLGTDIKIDGQDSKLGPDSGILNTIAVASGKGGVGKSTLAVNLAIGLASEGYDVGLVDTDIYGPSIPTMFGIETARPQVNENRRIIPLEKYGVKLLSMGFLVDPLQAVVWRGPMVSGAVRQFLGETEWGELDFLILDLPPGTGDIQLTIVQTIALSSAIIISTPQKVALSDARKGIAMFEQVNVPVLGIVENMSFFSPPELPDKKYYLFGQGGARRLAEEKGIPLLAEIPFSPALRESCDDGVPLATMSEESGVFTDLAQAVVRQTWIRNATASKTEKIEIVKG